MKTLISVIGQLKIPKLKSQSGFSLFEIVVVISLISVLSYFISLSPFFINKEKNVKSLDEKIKLIEAELAYYQRYALSINSYIKLDTNNQFNSNKVQTFNKNAFTGCHGIDKNIDYVYIFPSASTTEILINCNIMNTNYLLHIDNQGNVQINE